MNDMDINKNAIISLIMKRQHFLQKADEDEYEHMFSMMSPVPTVYWCASVF